jgi:hypothetical protein
VTVNYRQQAHALIDKLPDATVIDLLTWIQSKRARQQEQNKKVPDFAPVALGGLWQGLRVSEEEITLIRQEIWAGFGEMGT